MPWNPGEVAFGKSAPRFGRNEVVVYTDCFCCWIYTWYEQNASRLKGELYVTQKTLNADVFQPSNILFAGQNWLKVCDLGTINNVVYVREDGGQEGDPEQTARTGTPMYMAPEQVTLDIDFWLSCPSSDVLAIHEQSGYFYARTDFHRTLRTDEQRWCRRGNFIYIWGTNDIIRILLQAFGAFRKGEKPKIAMTLRVVRHAKSQATVIIKV